MNFYQCAFTIYVEVAAENADEAKELARDQLAHAGLGFSDVMDLDDAPVSTLEVGENHETTSPRRTIR